MLDRRDLMNVVNIGLLLTSEKDPNCLMEKITSVAMETANCDAGTLYLYREGKLEFKIMKTISKGVNLGGNGDAIVLPPVPMKKDNVCAYSAIHHEAINIKDVYESERFNFRGPRKYDAMTNYRTKSMLVVPLLDIKNELIGVLQLINALDETTGEIVPFSEDMEIVIRSIGSQAAVAISNNILAREAEIAEQEMEFARTIQFSTLPGEFPAFPDRPEIDIYASMDSAKEVGGDFYDFYFVDDKHFAFLVADVSGKGITAAMFMMKAKTLLKYSARQIADVDKILMNVNAGLCEGNDAEMFVTCWIGILDLETNKLRFSSAGHNPPLIRRAGGSFEWLRTRPSLPLAAMEGVRYRCNETDFMPGDEIFLYTDGVTEAQNFERELFGDNRLIDNANELCEDSAKGFCTALRERMDAFVGDAPQFDDVTMLSFRLGGVKEVPAEDAWELCIGGTRGSAAVTCQSHSEFGGDTLSLRLKAGGELIYIDAGSGLLPMPEGESHASVLIGHAHFDHICGLGMWSALGKKTNTIDFYMAEHDGYDCLGCIDRLYTAPLWPIKIGELAADSRFRDIKGDFEIGSVKIQVMDGNHPNGVTHFRISDGQRSLVYAVDAELTPEYTERVAEFAKGCDLLIADAMYAPDELKGKEGWGHSSTEQVAELGKKAGAKQTLCIHYQPHSSDEELQKHEKAIKAKYPNCRFARQGETIRL